MIKCKKNYNAKKRSVIPISTKSIWITLVICIFHITSIKGKVFSFCSLFLLIIVYMFVLSQSKILFIHFKSLKQIFAVKLVDYFILLFIVY